ncbi:MAG: MATE family efflux transporter [Ruminococcus sp.]|nr:MATE family efflux transporter [Ruminococcus sp.]
MKNRTLDLLKNLILLSIPTVIEEVMSTLLQYVDTAMVGRLGEAATASVSVTTTVSWLVHSIPSALGVGILALISRAVGSGNRNMVKRLSRQTLIFVLLSGAVIGGLSMALSPFIPKWMGAEVDIQRQASIYFFIISVPMVFRIASMLFGSAIRATKDTATPMLINLGANLLNIGLNYLLIYVCSLGVTGAAIGTAVSYTVAGVGMYIAYRRKTLLKYKLKTLSFDKAIMKECGKISLPVMMTSVVSCMGYVVFASLVTNMGTTVFAAHSIAVTAETIFYIPGYGLRTATSTMVGNSLGEGDRKKFNSVGRLSVAITIVMMILNGVILYKISLPLMYVFTKIDSVAVLGAQMLRLVAFSEPFFGIMIVMEGIFYGLGRTKYAFIIETFSMWCIRILFTFLCVKVWNYDLTAVWYCMIADNVAKAILFVAPLISKKFRSGLFKIQAHSEI